jgi:protein gp37
MASKINYPFEKLESWNPIKVKNVGGYHCTHISNGCDNCWAEAVNLRFGNGIPYDGRPVEFTIDEKILAKPLHWKKPRTIFVCDMCDLFHEDINLELIQRVHLETIESQHRFLILTKRPERMAEYFNSFYKACHPKITETLYLGLTVCNQQEADEKIPILLSIPAAHRWISVEPCLEAIDLWRYAIGYDYRCGINWVVVGSESGPHRRPAKLEWIQSIVDQCREAGVPCYVKQVEINGRLSKDPADWPPSLRVRQGI